MKNADHQIISREDSEESANRLRREGQFLPPMLELIEAAIDEVIYVISRAPIEAILLLSVL